VETLRQYRRADQVVFGGGTLFTDEVPRTIWISGLQILPAILLRKKIVCLCQGVGPIHKNFSKWVVRQLFSRFWKIQVRDPESAEILKAIGVTKTIEIAPDPAFTIELKSTRSPKKSSKKLLVSLRDGSFLNPDFSEKLATFLDQVHAQQKLQTAFLIFENNGNDRALSEKVARLMTSHKPAITSVDFGNFESIFATGAAALNFRLHANILSFMYKIPCIGFAYETKVKNLFKSVGKANFVIEPNDFEGLEKKWKNLIHFL
jgi:polysaccharide pyruvyl transferase WcaK-like protein